MKKALLIVMPLMSTSALAEEPTYNWQVPYSIQGAQSETCSRFEIGWARTDIRSMEVIRYADAYARWDALGCDPAVPILFDHCVYSMLGEIPVLLSSTGNKTKEVLRFCATAAVSAAKTVPE